MSLLITALSDPEPTPSSRRLAWLAADSTGVPVGSAFLRLFTKEGQEHLAELEVAVHPAERRRGAGDRLLDAAVSVARAEGRRSLVAQAAYGSPGDLFLAARGFRRVLALTYARLPLVGPDLVRIDGIAERPHPGYALTRWDGTVPPHLARTYADSRRAMDDMPMEETDYGNVVWDVARVVAAAEAVAKRGSCSTRSPRWTARTARSSASASSSCPATAGVTPSTMAPGWCPSTGATGWDSG